MFDRISTLGLAVMLAGGSLLCRAADSSTTADDAARNQAGEPRAVPGENEWRGGYNPEIKSSENPKLAEGDPQFRSNQGQANGSGSATGTIRSGTSRSGNYGHYATIFGNSEDTNRSGSGYSSETNRSSSDYSSDMNRSSGDYSSNTNRSGNYSTEGNSSYNRNSFQSSDDYSNGSMQLPRSFSAVKDPDFQIADYEQDRGWSNDRSYRSGMGRERASRNGQMSRSRASASNRGGSRVNLSGESQSAATTEGSDLQRNSGSSTNRETGSSTDRNSENMSSSDRNREDTSNNERNEGSNENSNSGRKAGKMSSVLHHGDKTFARHAADINAEEIAMGRLAAQRASDQRVKDFANKMVQDHSKANDTLLAIEDVKSWNIQQGINEAQQKVEKMSADWQGAEFDRHFIDHMIRGHQKAANEYQEATEDVHSAALKDYARTTLPVINEHLRTARELQASLGGGNQHEGRKLLPFHRKSKSGTDAQNNGNNTGNNANNSGNSSNNQ